MISLMIQTYISNLKPQMGVMVRQMISEWPTSALEDFQKTLSEKDAAGCFEIKQKLVSAHFQGGPHNGPPQGNNGQWGGRGRGGVKGRARSRGRGRGFSQNPPGNSRTRCFNCGAEDHWRNQCPYESQDQTSQPLPLPQNNTKWAPNSTNTRTKIPHLVAKSTTMKLS